MQKIVNFSETLIALFAKLGAFLVLALSFLVVYDASNRYFFKGGSVALQELEWHLFDIIFLLGLSYALQTDKHVRVDIFYADFSKKTKAFIEIVSQIFLIIPFTLLVLFISYDFVMQSYLQNEISADPGGLTHRYLIKAVILAGFFLLLVQSLCNLYKNIMIFRKSK